MLLGIAASIASLSAGFERSVREVVTAVPTA